MTSKEFSARYAESLKTGGMVERAERARTILIYSNAVTRELAISVTRFHTVPCYNLHYYFKVEILVITPVRVRERQRERPRDGKTTKARLQRYIYIYSLIHLLNSCLEYCFVFFFVELYYDKII